MMDAGFRNSQSLFIWILSLPNKECGREFDSAGGSLALKRSPRYLEPFCCHLSPLSALKSLWLQPGLSVLVLLLDHRNVVLSMSVFLGEVKAGECSEVVAVPARGGGLAGAAPQEGPGGEGAAGLPHESSAEQHRGSEQGEGEAGGGLQEFGEEVGTNQKVGAFLFCCRDQKGWGSV